MLCNTSVTVYHKNGFAIGTKNINWVRYNYANAWFFGGEGSSVNKGYDNANDVEIRLPYDKNPDLDINNFSRGDIIVEGTLNTDITKQQDLKDYTIYNITSKIDNKFGTNPHIHIGGK